MRFIAFLWLFGALSVQAQVQILEFTAGSGLVLLPITAASAGDEPTKVTDATTKIYGLLGLGTATKLAAINGVGKTRTVTVTVTGEQ